MDHVQDCIGPERAKSVPSLDFEVYSPISVCRPSISSLFIIGVLSLCVLPFLHPFHFTKIVFNTMTPSWLQSNASVMIITACLLFYMNPYFSSFRQRHAVYIEIFPHGIQLSEKTLYFGQTSNMIQSVTGPIRFIPMEDIVHVILVEMVLSYKVMDCLMLRVVSSSQKNDLIPIVSPHRIPLCRKDCLNLLQGIQQGIDSLRQQSVEKNVNS